MNEDNNKQDFPEYRESSPYEPDLRKRSPLEYQNDLTRPQKIVLIIMTILWLVLVALRIFGLVNESKIKTPQLNADYKNIDKLLYLNLGKSDPGFFINSVITGINSQAVSTYRERLQAEPANRQVLIELCILKYMSEKRAGEDEKDTPEKDGVSLKESKEPEKSGDTEEKPAKKTGEATDGKISIEDANALELYSLLKPKMGEDKELSSIFSVLYFPDRKEPIPQKEAAMLEKAVNNKLSGWFRDYSLYLLYTRTDNRAGLDRIHRLADEKSSSLALGYILIALMIIAGLIGLFLLLAFPVLTFYLYKHSLDDEGIRSVEGGRFTRIIFLKAWFIFMCWEMLRLGFAIFNTVYMGRFSALPAGILVIGYVLIYSITSLLIIKIFNLNLPRLDLSPIGITVKNIKGRIIELFVGAGGYCVTLVLVFIVALIVYYIMKVPARSQNPAFNVMDNSGSTLEIILLYLMVGIAGPIFEEILFRGVIYTSVRRKLPALASLFLVSFLFAFIHFDFGVIINLFVVGFVLGALYERTGSIIPSMITHILWNSATFFLYISFFIR